MTTQTHTAQIVGVPAAGAPAWRRPVAALRTAPATSSVLFFLALHVPLVLAMKIHPLVPTIHAVLTLLLGVHSIATSRRPDALLALLGYVVACEPLWRANKAMVFHETGKYALAALAGLALLRFRLWRRADKTAFLYFLLLLPSLLVLPGFDRQQISFNLSGPFALASATLLMSAYRISKRTLLRIFVMMIAPLSGMAFLGTVSTLTTSEDINFYVSKLPSAGLGKNQASSALALVGLLAFLFLCVERRQKLQRIVVGVLGVWCTALAALTFSRGGVATMVGAIAVAVFFLLRDRRSRSALVFRTVLLLALASYVVVPFLDTVTSGALRDRFSDHNLTGRDRLIEADLLAFREHPLLGVGPGRSKIYHVRTFRQVTAHTEYSRLLAEHGLFGLASLLLLVWMVWKGLRRPVPPLPKALGAGLIAWSLLFMFHAAIRMAAPCLTFALGISLLRGGNTVRFWDRHVPQADSSRLAGLPGKQSTARRNTARAFT